MYTHKHKMTTVTCGLITGLKRGDCHAKNRFSKSALFKYFQGCWSQKNTKKLSKGAKTCIKSAYIRTLNSTWAERLRDVIHMLHAASCMCKHALCCEFSRVCGQMMKRCVAANCSNKKLQTVSLFNSPKTLNCAKMVKNVQWTRAEWKGQTQNSVLCSEHFESSCFEASYDFTAKMGLQMRRKLKPNAVPRDQWHNRHLNLMDLMMPVQADSIARGLLQVPQRV